MKKPALKLLAPFGLVLGSALSIIGCGGSSSTTTSSTTTSGTYDTSLKFDASSYTSITVTVDGTSMKVRKYGPINYVANPVKMATTQSSMMGSTTLSTGYEMQEMYIYVPEASASNQTTGIWMTFNNAGWMFSVVKDTITDGATFTSSDTTPIAYALNAGYVIASVGTRGRMAVAADGTYAGKAPACIVDAKAAIRYMKLNDSLMPGSAERIIIDGTSGGGGLVTTVGASGDSSDYYSYLATIGAAGVNGSGSSATSTLSDKVFAVQAYCPINNLAHADEGHEWQFNAVRGLSNTITVNGTSTAVTLTPSLGGYAYTDASSLQPTASATIMASFPTYVSGLGLKLEDGSAFTTTKLPTLILAQLEAEINRQIAAGTSIPAYGDTFSLTVNGFGGSSTYGVTNDWLTLSGSGTSAVVQSIDYTKFLKFVASITALKTVVAFDATGVTGNTSTTSGEASEYGASTTAYSNFSEYSWNNNTIVGDSSGLCDTGLTWNQYLATTSGKTLASQLKMTSPIPYLATNTSGVAPYWYVRHGMIDRDTSFAIQMLLYYSIYNNSGVKDLNFRLPYMTPHSGDYDASTAFTWIKGKLAAGN